MGSIIKTRLNKNARESVEDSTYDSSRTDGIEITDNWKSDRPDMARAAERYESWNVPGVNVQGPAKKHR